MKRFIIFQIILILEGFNSYSQDKFEITPIVFNFNGISTKGDTISAYGDFGTMFLSFDNTKSWKQISPFQSGIIINVFIDNFKLIAINDLGQVAQTNNTTDNWVIINNYNEKFLAALKFPNGYLFRTDKRLIFADTFFQQIKEYKLNSPALGNAYSFQYLRSIVFYQNNFIIAIDKCNFLRFDSNLNFIDTIFFSQKAIGKNYSGNFQIETDSAYFYTLISGDCYKTKDFIKFELVYDKNFQYKVIDNQFYSVRSQSGGVNRYLGDFIFKLYKIVNKDTVKITQFPQNDFDFYSGSIFHTDFTVNKNKLIIVGQSKYLNIVDLSDNTNQLISDYSGYLLDSEVNKINDSISLIFGSALYKINSKDIKINPVLSYKDNPEFKYYSAFSISPLKFRYFDEENKELFFLGQGFNKNAGSIIKSVDLGKSLLYDSLIHYYPQGDMTIEKFQKTNSDYFICINSPNLPMWYTNIYRYSINSLEYSVFFHDSNRISDYFFPYDTTSFILHSQNTVSKTYELKYTSNNGKTWDIIKSYNSKNKFCNLKELTIKNSKVLAIFNQRYDSLNGYFTSLEILDLQSRKLKQIYELNESIDSIPQGNLYNSIEIDKGVVYFTINDTLFVLNNLDIDTIQKYPLPNRGKIKQTFRKFGNRFYSRYIDENHKENLYWITIKDTNLTKTEVSIEAYNYLYIFPPYPLPANDEVNIHIYWDSQIDISTANITVYNLLGEKVSLPNDIKIIPYSNWDGLMKWNCTGQQNGIYLINITYGDNNKTIPVIVGK